VGGGEYSGAPRGAALGPRGAAGEYDPLRGDACAAGGGVGSTRDGASDRIGGRVIVTGGYHRVAGADV
jgi:hypothetical protein